MNVSHNSVSCYDESHLWILEHGFIHCVIYPNWDASKHVPPKKEIGSTCYVVIMFFSHMLLIYGMGLN